MMSPLQEKFQKSKLRKRNYTPLRIFLTVNVVVLSAIIGLTMLLKRGEVPQKTNPVKMIPSGKETNLGMEIYLIPNNQFSDAKTLEGEIDELIKSIGGRILERKEGSLREGEGIRILVPRNHLDGFWLKLSSLGDIRTINKENEPQDGSNLASSGSSKTPPQNIEASKDLSSIPINLSIVYSSSQQ